MRSVGPAQPYTMPSALKNNPNSAIFYYYLFHINQILLKIVFHHPFPQVFVGAAHRLATRILLSSITIAQVVILSFIFL